MKKSIYLFVIFLVKTSFSLAQSTQDTTSQDTTFLGKVKEITKKVKTDWVLEPTIHIDFPNVTVDGEENSTLAYGIGLQAYEKDKKLGMRLGLLYYGHSIGNYELDYLSLTGMANLKIAGEYIMLSTGPSLYLKLGERTIGGGNIFTSHPDDKPSNDFGFLDLRWKTEMFLALPVRYGTRDRSILAYNYTLGFFNVANPDNTNGSEYKFSGGWGLSIIYRF